MNNCDLAYIAGFFDGEGCIHGGLQNKKGPRGPRKGYPRVHITIGQKDPFILKYIKNYFDFGVVKPVNKRKSPRDYNWIYIIKSTQEVHTFLESIFSCLKGKKSQAKIAIILTQHILKSTKGVSIGLEEEMIRRKMVKKITELKKEEIYANL